MDPVREALTFKKAVLEHGSQEKAALAIGVKRSLIAKRLRLLTLPPQVVDALSRGLITSQHAEALLLLPREAILTESRHIFSFRSGRKAIEWACQRKKELLDAEVASSSNCDPSVLIEELSPDLAYCEATLASAFNTRVKVTKRRGEWTEVTFTFFSNKELSDAYEHFRKFGRDC